MNLTRVQATVVSVLSALVIVAGVVAIPLLVNHYDEQPPTSFAPESVSWTPAIPEDPRERHNDTMERAYLASLDFRGIRHANDLTALALARKVCRALESGSSVLAAAAIPAREGYDSYDSGYIVGAASRSICQQIEVR